MRRLTAIVLAAAAASGSANCEPRGTTPQGPADPNRATVAPDGSAAAAPRCSGSACDAPCRDGSAPDGAGSCTSAPTPERRAALDAEVERARAAVLASGFSDAAAMVELARLELVRDAAPNSAPGGADGRAGYEDARRAVAVDDRSAAPRLVLALGLARSFVGAQTFRGPTLRALASDLVAYAAGAAERAADNAPSTAAALSLRGFAALERGDARGAQSAFAAARARDPELVAACLGLGDAARALGDFDAAGAAYRAAIDLAPDDADAWRGRDAAGRRERAHLGPTSEAPRPPLGGDALLPAPSPPSCPRAALADDRQRELCAGLVDLAHAQSPAALGAAATRIVKGRSELRAACSAHEPACGTHLAPALLAAAHAFRAAGLLAKSIAVDKMLLDPGASLPGADALEPAALVHAGDGYFAIAVFSEAAAFYERATRTAPQDPLARAARARALALGASLGDVDAMTRLASLLADDSTVAESERADAVLLAFHVVLETRGRDAAEAFVAPLRPLLESRGLGAGVAQLLDGNDDVASAPAPPWLARGVRLLARETRWSGAAAPPSAPVP